MVQIILFSAEKSGHFDIVNYVIKNPDIPKIENVSAAMRLFYLHLYGSQIIESSKKQEIISLLEPYIGDYMLRTEPVLHFSPRIVASQKDRMNVRKEKWKSVRGQSLEDVAASDPSNEADPLDWRQESLFEKLLNRHLKSRKNILASKKIDYANLLDFAGILELQRQGLFGRDVNVLVSEPDGVKQTSVMPCVGCLQLSENDHGVMVMSVISKIAPQAVLSGIGSRSKIQEKYDICNMSWGKKSDIAKKNIMESIEGFIRDLVENPDTLFVRSAGNEPQRLIDRPMEKMLYGSLLGSSQSLLKQLHNIMWVTNITPYGVLAASSTYPSEEFKEHTISALGTDVEVMNNDETSIRSDGTSFSAPTVTGVAALLKGAFSSFTPFDLKTCLLESADQYMFENYGPNGNYGSRENNGRIRLDPTKYGKGILNARHALLYAEILNTKRAQAWHGLYESEVGESYTLALTNEQLREATVLVPAESRIVKEAYQRAVEREEKSAANIIGSRLKDGHGQQRAKERLLLQEEGRDLKRSRDRDRILQTMIG